MKVTADGQTVTAELTPDDYAFAGSWFKKLLSRPRIKRNPKGCIGVVLALKHPVSQKDNELVNQLIKNLDNYLRLSKSPLPLKLLELPLPIAAWIDGPDNKKRADNYLFKSRAQIILYGNYIRAGINGVPAVTLSMNATVIHLEISTQKFADEIKELLPYWHFPEVGEFEGFVFYRRWLGWVTKYITAVGALLSNEPEVASVLLNELKQELERVVDPRVPVQKILSKLDSGFREVERLRIKLSDKPDAVHFWRDMQKLKIKRIES